MGDGADKRKYARIEASISCTVATSADAFDAALANLSKGGAAVLGPEGSAGVGEKVTLMLERDVGGPTLSLPGTVRRIEARGEHTLFGIEFDALPPEEETQLSALLHALAAGKGPGRRAHPRVAARVDVECKSEDSFRGFLNDLSRGGLSVKTLRDVELGKTLVVSFGVPGIKGLVEVSGIVVSNQKLEHGWRIGVFFTPMKEADREQVNRTLDVLLGIKVVTGEILEE
ncbi:MAG: PilZ domain-containing protein [Myxococcaceae bacterium]|nr:PilZ domain-containing protein [Myxococcaceae bacterium]